MKTKPKKSKSKPTFLSLDEARAAVDKADAGAREAKTQARSAKSKIKAARKAFKRLDKAAKTARKEFRRARKTLESLIASQAEPKKKPVVRRGTLQGKPVVAVKRSVASMPMVAASPGFAGDQPEQSLE